MIGLLEYILMTCEKFIKVLKLCQDQLAFLTLRRMHSRQIPSKAHRANTSFTFGIYASMLPQKKPNFPERFRKELEYADTPS